MASRDFERLLCVRQLLAQSGRYRVIDVSAANADAVKAHTLRDCGGCDATIALKLGAEQSLVGVVRRVSRTEYTVGFQVRDAWTGAVVSVEIAGFAWAPTIRGAGARCT